MAKLVSIRGTHGSGKSTVVRKILDKYPHEELRFKASDKRPYAYRVSLPTGEALVVIGPYHTACGGCDAIQPYADILEYIRGAIRNDEHALFEGALVSSSYGTVGKLLNDHVVEGGESVFAFLDTPLQTCLERIKARRAAKGNLEPLNPHNTTVKFDNVARTKVQMKKLDSQVSIVDIDHTRATQQVLKLFGVTIRKEL